MQRAMSFNDVAIVYVKAIAYRIHFWYMSKDDVISVMNNSNLVDKKGVSWFFLLYIYKWVRNRDVILNRAKDCYENDKKTSNR